MENTNSSLMVKRGNEISEDAGSIPVYSAEYLAWKKQLIEVTDRELAASGWHSDYKIVDAVAVKCFQSGMSPLQTFREFFEQ